MALAPRVTKAAQQRAAREERAEARRQGAVVKDSLGTAAGRRTSDSFQNFLLGQGQGTDNALSQSTYGFNPITRNRVMLDWMYRGSWVCAQGIDAIAEDMTRRGVDWQGFRRPADRARLDNSLSTYGVWASLADTKRWSRLYGGSIAVIMIDGERMDEPLNLDAVREGSFRGILPLDRWMVDADLTHLVGDLGPNVGLPMYYTIQADAPVLRGQRVHYSRVVRMEGVRLPYWQRVTENMWGESVLERVYDRLVAFDSATAGTAQLVYKSFLRTYKVKGLRSMLGEGGDALEMVLRYTDMMRRTQSIEGMTLIDADDDMVVNQSNVQSGVSDALVQLGQQLCGGFKVPAVRFFGQSPAGLNATGESDFRNYYDGIHQAQEFELRAPVNVVARVAAASEGIQLADDFNFTFNSLWEMDEEQKAEISSKDTDSILKMLDSGLVEEDVILSELRARGKVVGRWQTITDEMILDVRENGPPRPNIAAQAPGDNDEMGDKDEGSGAGNTDGGDEGGGPAREKGGDEA